MSLLGFGPTRLPFGMFDLARSAKEARRAEKLANIYHRGQELTWDGRQVLGELIEKHGGIRLPLEKTQALSRLFGILMWGEMAAWKISAQLADRLVPLEARMAATSQVHDEARHFYVLHDYLQELGHVPRRISRSTQVLLDSVLETDDLAAKLLGMQLLIETIALTLFQTVREARVEPVLAELLRYFEKDEARHVGLGLQHLPEMLRRMPRRRALRLIAFQAWIMGWAMAELKALEPDLRTLGLDPRHIFTLGIAKQALVFQTLWTELGGKPSAEATLADRLIMAAGELLFPRSAEGRAWHRRLVGAARAFQGDVADMPAVSLDPEEEKRRPELIPPR